MQPPCAPDSPRNRSDKSPSTLLTFRAQSELDRSLIKHVHITKGNTMSKQSVSTCIVALTAVAVSASTVLADAAASPHSVTGVFAAGGSSGTDADAINACRAQGSVYGSDGDITQGAGYTLERVVCMTVEGNRATIGTQILQTNNPNRQPGTFQLYYVIDNGPAGSSTPDLVGGGFVGATKPTCTIDHSNPPAGYVPITTGDITVH
jgi:hypothetical protein